MASRRRHTNQAVQEPEERPTYSTWPSRPTGKFWPRSGCEGPLVFFDTATGKELGSFGKEFSSGMGFDLLADRRIGRWPSRPMEGRSRPPETGSPFTSGTWRRARTVWPLPKPTWATWWPSHASPTARRSSPAAGTGPPGSGTWRRGDRRGCSPTIAGSIRSRSPPMGRSLPRAPGPTAPMGEGPLWNPKPASGSAPGRSMKSYDLGV